MNSLKNTLFVIAFSGVSGCVQKHTRPLETPAMTESNAVVYLYRPASMSNIVISPTVVVDNRGGFEMANGNYTYMVMEPGGHRLRLELSERYQGRHEQEFNVEAGGRYYFRIDTRLKFRKNDLYQRRFDLLRMETDSAISEISACSYFPLPGHQKEGTVQPGKIVDDGQSEDAHFSISRSRDPFGRNK